MQNTPCKNTLDWFSELSQISDPNIAYKYCLPAVKSLQAKVKKQDTVVDEVPELYFAAAVLAYYRLSVTDEFLTCSSFKAGDVRLNMKPDILRHTLQELLSIALSDALPYLKSGVKFKAIG